MSKLNGMQIFELLSNVNDNLIVESVAPALLVGGATGAVAGLTGGACASSAGTVGATAAKTGFAAWLAKGGWLALLAGVLVATAVAVGVGIAGRDPGGTLPVSSDDVTTETAEQGIAEDTEPVDSTEGDTRYETPDGTSHETTGEAETEIPTFDVEASLAAIDQMMSGNVSVTLKYNTQTYDGLTHEFKGGFGRVDGKYWTRVDLDGTAVLDEEGGYYHKYTFESSKWRYYNTYEMTDREEYDKVLNGRYWWKNYLDEMTFEAYDKLVYTGTESYQGRNYHVFSYEGTVTDGSRVKLILHAHVYDGNVRKLEAEILERPNQGHLSTDPRRATVELFSVKTGENAVGPTLPDPKWDGSNDEIEDPEDPSQGGNVVPPSVLNPSIDPGNGMLEQYPLLSPDDTASYVVLPELMSGTETAVAFYILPTDLPDPAHINVLQYTIPENSTVNLQIVAVEKSPEEYCFLFMMEYLEECWVDGEEAYRVVMTCGEFQFFESTQLSGAADAYYTVREQQFVELFYTLPTMQSVIDENRDRSLEALNKAQTWLADYTEDAGYTYTVLYGWNKDGEVIKTPVNWIPSFLFDLYRDYGL